LEVGLLFFDLDVNLHSGAYVYQFVKTLAL